MAFVASLRDGAIGADKATDLAGSEFNLPTLFGEDVSAYESLLRWVHRELPTADIQRVVAGHIEHGLEELKKARTLLELMEHAVKASSPPALPKEELSAN
jgi:DNA sulfur modification protein DndE